MTALYLFLIGAAKFIYSNPAVSLLAFILSVQFGCMSTAVLLGGVPMQCYLGNGDIPTVGVAAGVWFLVFFSPFDLFYKICNISLVKVRVCLYVCTYILVYVYICTYYVQSNSLSRSLKTTSIFTVCIYCIFVKW